MARRIRCRFAPIADVPERATTSRGDEQAPVNIFRQLSCDQGTNP
jgi:hypothetical protein